MILWDTAGMKSRGSSCNRSILRLLQLTKIHHASIFFSMNRPKQKKISMIFKLQNPEKPVENNIVSTHFAATSF